MARSIIQARWWIPNGQEFVKHVGTLDIIDIQEIADGFVVNMKDRSERVIGMPHILTYQEARSDIWQGK